jgi:hypothetical protein
MFTYDDMRCRECGQNIVSNVRCVDRAKEVKKYADFYFMRPKCRCALSNSRAEVKRTKI